MAQTMADWPPHPSSPAPSPHRALQRAWLCQVNHLQTQTRWAGGGGHTGAVFTYLQRCHVEQGAGWGWGRGGSCRGQDSEDKWAAPTFAWDFPSGSTLPMQGTRGSIPDRGSKVPRTAQLGQNKKIKDICQHDSIYRGLSFRLSCLPRQASYDYPFL